MINLLPYDMKKQLKAARLNSILIRYIIVLLISTLFIGLLGLGLNYYIDLTQNSIGDKSEQAGSASMTNAEMTSKATDINQKVASVKSAVETGTSYSQILINLAQKLPSGVILETLSLSDSELSKTIELTFYAKNNDSARKIKDQLSSSAMFKNISEPTITTIDNPAFSGYPTKVVLSLTIDKGAVQ